MEVRNPSHNAHGTFDCEINHPVYGWIPFTADPNDDVDYGRQIYADIAAGKHGEPAAYVPPVPTHEQVELQRQLAYADPLTGSDRLFSEAQRMQLMGDPGWEAKRDEAVARYQAIQAEFPWPEGTA